MNGNLIKKKLFSAVRYPANILPFLVLLMFCLTVVIGCDEESLVPVPRQDTYETTMKDGKVRMIFAGDLMMARNVGQWVEDDMDGDYNVLLEFVAPFLKRADVAFVNLESVISDLGQQLQTKVGPKFRADPKAITALSEAGIDVVSIANNHAFDYGKIAFEDSINTLREFSIMDIGGGFNAEEAYRPITFKFKADHEKDDVVLAFIAFNAVGTGVFEAQEDSTGVAWLTDENLEAGIRAARACADIVITSLHFGTEYETDVSNSDQIRFARLAVDLGADLVVGHHPHVVQPIEIYNGKYIAFSLGNLVFDQLDDEDTRNGILLDVTVEQKTVTGVDVISYRINDTYQPVVED